MKLNRLTVPGLVLLLFIAAPAVLSEPDLESRISELEEQLASQDRELETLKEEAGIGSLVLFLFGFVFSIWAMNRNRSGCGWFILGFLPGINVVAGLVALWIESDQPRTATGRRA